MPVSGRAWNPARLVGDVRVDLGLVAAQPLEAGPLLEGSVERAEVGGLVGVEQGRDAMGLGGPAQDEGIDVRGVVQDVPWTRYRASVSAWPNRR